MTSETGSMSDLFLFAATSAAAVAFQKATCGRCSETTDNEPVAKSLPAGSLKNSAFVFVKPHANTEKVQELVRSKLTDAGIEIISEMDIRSEEIDEKKLIDQHYYAIASKATILPAKDIPVPLDKFESAFGEKWATVLSEERTCNALEACSRFGCDASALNEAWGKAKVEKFGGGFYCGLVTVDDKPPLYVFNAFFMSMRSKFVGKGTSIHCFIVEWKPSTLSWSSFRGELLGPTDPAEGPIGSIRKAIFDDYESLGLISKPNKGDNGVHASASPFEGLAEKLNWMEKHVDDDDFGKALLSAGLTEKLIKEWSVDPRVELPEGGKGSVFDALEDLNADDCLEKLVNLKKLN